MLAPLPSFLLPPAFSSVTNSDLQVPAPQAPPSLPLAPGVHGQPEEDTHVTPSGACEQPGHQDYSHPNSHLPSLSDPLETSPTLCDCLFTDLLGLPRRPQSSPPPIPSSILANKLPHFPDDLFQEDLHTLPGIPNHILRLPKSSSGRPCPILQAPFDSRNL